MELVLWYIIPVRPQDLVLDGSVCVARNKASLGLLFALFPGSRLEAGRESSPSPSRVGGYT